MQRFFPADRLFIGKTSQKCNREETGDVSAPFTFHQLIGLPQRHIKLPAAVRFFGRLFHFDLATANGTRKTRRIPLRRRIGRNIIHIVHIRLPIHGQIGQTIGE